MCPRDARDDSSDHVCKTHAQTMHTHLLPVQHAETCTLIQTEQKNKVTISVMNSQEKKKAEQK